MPLPLELLRLFDMRGKADLRWRHVGPER